MKYRLIFSWTAFALLTMLVGLRTSFHSFILPTSHAQDTAIIEPSELPPPVLPVVVKVEPAQPPTGLKADDHLDKTPPRATKGLDLVKMGWSYNCMECHRSVEVKWHRDRVRVEHENIELSHGNNRFCLNCHNSGNMNAFADYDGSEIAEKDVVMLCAKCHGTTYRDWEAGVHGRRNGFWDASQGAQSRLRCIQCHDPHNPKFKPIKALPAPKYPRRAAAPHKPADERNTER